MPSPFDPPAPAPRAVPDATRFRFDGVALLVGAAGPAGAASEGRVDTTDHRTSAVVLDESGIVVDGPGPVLHASWAEVDRVVVGGTSTDREGAPVTALDIESSGRRVRILVGSDAQRSVQLAALQAWLAARSALTPAPLPPPSAPWAAPVLAPPPSGVRVSGPVHFAPPARPPPRFPPPAFPPAPDPVAAPSAPMAPPHPSHRTRRWPLLVAGVVLIGAGIGLAFELAPGHSVHSGRSGPSASAPAPPRSSDQRLADRLMLTRADLPPGWRAEADPVSGGDSRRLAAGEAAVTRSFAGCLGVSEAQASVALGGQAGDQTAVASSPVFLSPTGGGSGTTLELQTAADIVRTPSDEQQDFALLGRPGYPQCLAGAVASQVQLGIDVATGGHGQPGPARAVPLSMATPAGVQRSALEITFTVSDGAGQVPVEMEGVSLGHDRIEASLQAIALGGSIPSQVLSGSLATFGRRVADGGSDASV
jgi:hypothetical protein